MDKDSYKDFKLNWNTSRLDFFFELRDDFGQEIESKNATYLKYRKAYKESIEDGKIKKIDEIIFKTFCEFEDKELVSLCLRKKIIEWDIIKDHMGDRDTKIYCNSEKGTKNKLWLDFKSDEEKEINTYFGKWQEPLPYPQKPRKVKFRERDITKLNIFLNIIEFNVKTDVLCEERQKYNDEFYNLDEILKHTEYANNSDVCRYLTLAEAFNFIEVRNQHSLPKEKYKQIFQLMEIKLKK